MRTPGYIYVLINQSLPNCVKIGKTTKDPSNRASELSSATGVPTPFLVVFEAYFNDCDAAESYIHAFLESKGVRLSQNREFFTVSPTVAINAVYEAQQRLETPNKNISIDVDDRPYNDEVLSELLDFTEEDEQEPWESVLEEAENYDVGWGDCLQDHARAIKLFKNAAKLGSSKAYLRLAELIADFEGDAHQGLEWLKRGADKGFPDCWLELANVFCRENVYLRAIPISKENALKCYRKYLGFVDSQLLIKSERLPEIMFYPFVKYIQLIGETPEQRDIDTLKVFVQKFRKMLIERGEKGKLKQFDSVLANIHFRAVPNR